MGVGAVVTLVALTSLKEDADPPAVTRLECGGVDRLFLALSFALAFALVVLALLTLATILSS